MSDLILTHDDGNRLHQKVDMSRDLWADFGVRRLGGALVLKRRQAAALQRGVQSMPIITITRRLVQSRLILQSCT